MVLHSVSRAGRACAIAAAETSKQGRLFYGMCKSQGALRQAVQGSVRRIVLRAVRAKCPGQTTRGCR